MSQKGKRPRSRFVTTLDEIKVYSSPEEAAESKRKRKAEIKAGIEAMKRRGAEERVQQQAEENEEQSPEADGADESTEA